MRLDPAYIVDSQRSEKAWVKIVGELFACPLLYDCRKNVCSQAVVAEQCTWLMCHRVLHKESDPASVLDFPALVCRIGRMSAAHRQQMFHRDLLEVFGRILRAVLREDVHQLLVQCQFAFGNGKTDCHRCECLAD